MYLFKYDNELVMFLKEHIQPYHHMYVYVYIYVRVCVYVYRASRDHRGWTATTATWA
jgi:hypothetical protein